MGPAPRMGVQFCVRAAGVGALVDVSSVPLASQSSVERTRSPVGARLAEAEIPAALHIAPAEARRPVIFTAMLHRGRQLIRGGRCRTSVITRGGSPTCRCWSRCVSAATATRLIAS